MLLTPASTFPTSIPYAWMMLRWSTSVEQGIVHRWELNQGAEVQDRPSEFSVAKLTCVCCYILDHSQNCNQDSVLSQLIKTFTRGISLCFLIFLIFKCFFSWLLGGLWELYLYSQLPEVGETNGKDECNNNIQRAIDLFHYKTLICWLM